MTARPPGEAVTPPLAVRIPAAGVDLQADLAVPRGARGVVAFAHGSGSSRLSPRNAYVARCFNDAGLATLLVDLLTPGEERVDARTAELRFDIDLLTRRLAAIVDWLARSGETSTLAIGLFGASTGAAAAVRVAALRPHEVRAVVSRGGRVDLAAQHLRHATAPALFIVGGADREVLALNHDALGILAAAAKQLAVVPGASHLFEEPGALEEVARLATTWFTEHLTRRAAAAEQGPALSP